VISDFASLQTAVGNWLNKSGDANLTARIPEFIQLAEARFQRKLDDEQQNTVTTITFADGIAPLPADFDGLNSIDGDFQEDPVLFDVVGSYIRTDPAVTGSATINYRQGIPALSVSNTTNWLLTKAPDIYLFGALLQAEFFGWNDERLPLIKSAHDEMLDELHVNSENRRWNRDALAPRILRT
jgi:hypothetical protein